MKRFLLASLALLLATSALAQDADAQDWEYQIPDVTKTAPIEGEMLRGLFLDQMHRGYYNFLQKPDGDYGFSEMMNADGTTLHERDGVKSAGRWRVLSNLVCFTYDTLGGGCFTIYKQGNCNFAYSVDSRQFVAITIAGDDAPDCEPAIA